MNDSCFVQMSTHEVEQAKAMYDYSRQQEIAQQEQRKAEKKQRIIWYVSIAAILIVLYVLYRYYRKQEEQKRLLGELVSMQSEVMQLRERKANYDLLLQEKEQQAKALGTALSEIEDLEAEKSRFDQLLKEKEDKIEEQKASIGRYKRLARLEKGNVKAELEKASIYKQVSTKASKGEKLTDQEWEELERFVVSRFQSFYMLVSSCKYALTTNMYHVCILVRLQTPITSIANMMGVKPPTISNMCTVILKKLFNKEGSGKELEQELILFN